MPNGQKSILIVEDEYIIAMDLKYRLEALGYTVTEITNNGRRAVELTEQYRPDLILLDIIIKGVMDGLETSKAILTRFPVPIIFITASSDIHTIKKITDEEGCYYLHKPITDIDLEYTITMALNGCRMHGTIESLQNRINDTESFLIGFFRNTTLPCCYYQPEEDDMRCNPAFCRKFGASGETLSVRTIIDILAADSRTPHDFGKVFLETIRKAVSGKKTEKMTAAVSGGEDAATYIFHPFADSCLIEYKN